VSRHHRSEKQRQASRLNGAKSHGPVTEEGKAISSVNGFKHGRYACFTAVLRHEDPAESNEALQTLVDCHKPANDHQLSLLEAIAMAEWRLKRIVTIQTRAIDLELDRVATSGAQLHNALDATVVALASLLERNKLLQYINQSERTLHAELRWLYAELRRSKRDACVPEPVPVITDLVASEHIPEPWRDAIRNPPPPDPDKPDFSMRFTPPDTQKPPQPIELKPFNFQEFMRTEPKPPASNGGF
jgi:hypothetical protein